MPQPFFIHRYFNGEYRMTNRMTGEFADIDRLAARTIELNGVPGWSYIITESETPPQTEPRGVA